MSRMSYSNQFRGSPWQQDREPYAVRGYGQMYGGYGLGNQFSLASYYGQNRESSRSAYGSSAFSGFRSMGYGSPSPTGYFSSNRLNSYQDLYGPIQQKRLSQRAPAGSPRSKRPRLENGSRQGRTRLRWRRRRDTRRARKSNKSDNKLGESADDVSNTNYDDYDSWKSSEDENETSVTQGKEEQSANGVEKIKVETDESDKTKDEKKPLACHVCKVTCSTLERFGNHMTSRTHMSKVEKLLVLQKEKKQVKEASTKASQQAESRDRSRKDKDRKKRKQWCTVCEHYFPGSFLAHRRSKEHRKNRDKKYPKCHPCGVSLNSSEEYKAHCKEEKHKVKSAEFHYIRSLTAGSDDDTAAIEPAEVKTPVVKQEEDKAAKSAESVEKSEEKKEVGDSKPESKKYAVTKENQPPGQLFVVAAKGYYCKICRMFFKNGTTAKVKHCCSVKHSEAVKKGMKEAMEQEEERQKLADEREEREKKEAEEKAAIDGQKAPVEKAAEEVTMKETAEKKETPRADGTELKKSSDQSGNDGVEKMEVSSVAGADKTEEMEETGKEIKGNPIIEKASDVGGLFKQEPQDTGEKVNGVEKDKGVLEQHPSPALASTTVAERASEAAQPDSHGDKECEEVKKESPGSRGARRGRGRGRRR